MQDARENKQQGRILLTGFMLIIGVVAWYFGRHWYANWREEEAAGKAAIEAATDVALTELRFITPKEVLARLEREENMLLIDIRQKEDFNLEHVVDSLSIPVTTINSFSSLQGQLVIVITGSEIPNETLKGIHEFFTERRYTFAFLEGTLNEWKAAGGTTISTGDPTSIFDYSKVIFISPDQVSATAIELSDPLFLDVRSEEVFKKEHIPGAINIPLSDLERRRAEIPRGKSVFIYGENDYESYQGGVRLFDLNLFGARVIRGGFGAWKEKQLPTTTETR